MTQIARAVSKLFGFLKVANQPSHKLRAAGFSLIELSVVLTIIGVITASGLSIATSSLDRTKYTSSKDKMTEILASLQRFYATNYRLPCPADPSSAPSAGDYGQEIYSTSGATVGFCDAVTTPANSAGVGASTRRQVTSNDALGVPRNAWVRQGSLPTRALGIADGMMYDEYGYRFTYVVTEAFTTGNSTTPASATGAITVMDGLGNNLTIVAEMAVISHGKDHKGGYNKAGIRTTTCGATANLDVENCDTEAGDVILNDTQYNAGTVVASYFDDLIRWQLKDEVIGTTSGSTSSCDYMLLREDGYVYFPNTLTFSPALTIRMVAIGGGGGNGSSINLNTNPEKLYGGNGGSGHITAVSNSTDITSTGSYYVMVGMGGKGALRLSAGGRGYSGGGSGSIVSNIGTGGGGGGSSAFGNNNSGTIDTTAPSPFIIAGGGGGGGGHAAAAGVGSGGGGGGGATAAKVPDGGLSGNSGTGKGGNGGGAGTNSGGGGGGGGSFIATAGNGGAGRGGGGGGASGNSDIAPGGGGGGSYGGDAGYFFLTGSLVAGGGGGGVYVGGNSYDIAGASPRPNLGGTGNGSGGGGAGGYGATSKAGGGGGNGTTFGSGATALAGGAAAAGASAGTYNADPVSPASNTTATQSLITASNVVNGVTFNCTKFVDGRSAGAGYTIIPNNSTPIEKIGAGGTAATDNNNTDGHDGAVYIEWGQ